MYQPFLVDLVDWNIRVIGGGRVGLHKIKCLLRSQEGEESPPQILVISPDFDEGLIQLAKQSAWLPESDVSAKVLEQTQLEKQNGWQPESNVSSTNGLEQIRLKKRNGGKPFLHLQQRPYQEEDLDGADFVIAATADPALNQQIRKACQERHILCEIASGAASPVMTPSVVREEGLGIFLTTYGRYPALSRWAREHLQADPELSKFDEAFVHRLEEYRQLLLRQKPEDYRERIEQALQFSYAELNEVIVELKKEQPS